MQSLGRGSPGCKAAVEIPAERRPETSRKVAQLIMFPEFTVIIRPGRLSGHLLSFCQYVRPVTSREPGYWLLVTGV